MNINVEHQSNCRAVVHVHASAEDVAKHRSGIVAYYTRGAKLPGYRPGKEPAAVIQKRYGSAINEELERQLASEGLQTAIKNEGLEVINILGVSESTHHAADNSFTCNIELSLAPNF
mgnify:FL=1